MSGYIGNIPTPQATQSRQSFTATASQTSFATAGYTSGFLDVYLNGVHLLDGADYAATNGSDIVLTVGAAASDVLEVVSYSTFEVLDPTFTGTTTLTDSGAAPLVANRTASNGDIIDLQKDGASVGSIGSLNGVAGSYFGTGTTAISAYSGALRSVNGSTGSYVDNTINIGTASSRFKDLYLSGGVYLGGTGAANYWTGYEEGTFTPILSVGTWTVGDAKYVRNGNLCTVYIKGGFFSDTTSSLSIAIGGLPFNSPTDWDQHVVGTSMWDDTAGGKHIVYINSQSYLQFYDGVAAGSYAAMSHSALSGAGAYTHISATYRIT